MRSNLLAICILLAMSTGAKAQGCPVIQLDSIYPICDFGYYGSVEISVTGGSGWVSVLWSTMDTTLGI